jgi:hypothetical protein
LQGLICAGRLYIAQISIGFMILLLFLVSLELWCNIKFDWVNNFLSVQIQFLLSPFFLTCHEFKLVVWIFVAALMEFKSYVLVIFSGFSYTFWSCCTIGCSLYYSVIYLIYWCSNDFRIVVFICWEGGPWKNRVWWISIKWG